MSKMDQVYEDIQSKVAPIKGLTVNNSSFRVAFTPKGCKRVVETIADLDVTKNNVQIAIEKLASIKADIRDNCFDWARHFPRSKKAISASGIKKVPTVEEAMTTFLKHKDVEVRGSTGTNYEGKTNNHIYPHIGHLRVDAITVEMLKTYRVDCLAHLANKTIKDILAPLRTCFRELSGSGIISYNPFPDFKNWKIKSNKETTCDPFTREELDAIENTTTLHTSLLNGFLFASWSGLRVSEWLALAWEDVDFINRTVRVKRGVVSGNFAATKTDGSYRTVNLIEPAYQFLLKQKAISFMLNGTKVSVLDDENRRTKNFTLRFVFVSHVTQLPYRYSNQANEDFFRGHLRRSGVSYRAINQARHTFASQLFTKGIDINWIAEQIGHTNINTLRKFYAKWIDSEKPDMANQVSKNLGFESSRKNKKVG